MIRVETPAQLTSYLGVSVCMTVYSVGTCDGMLLLLVTSVTKCVCLLVRLGAVRQQL